MDLIEQIQSAASVFLNNFARRESVFLNNFARHKSDSTKLNDLLQGFAVSKPKVADQLLDKLISEKFGDLDTPTHKNWLLR